MVFQALAQEPPLNPNGFPSGDHYNLNLIGKKSDFNKDDLGCGVDPLAYGNVVFVPEWGQGDIWLNSGKKATATTLQVTDSCVTAFDGDAAELNLPANANGYWVYARALGKLDKSGDPYDPTRWMLLTPQLVTYSYQNEDLSWLGGLGTSSGWAFDGHKVTRTKGKHPAIKISDLFTFTGYVCYNTDPGGYALKGMCVKDTNADTIPDVMVEPGVNDACPDGYTLTQVYCQYHDSEWIFNIADLVNYFWQVDSHGSKLVQIRFYPR